MINQNIPLRHSFSKDASSITYRAAYNCGFYCGYSPGFMGVTGAAVQDFPLRRALCWFGCSAVAVMKFLIFFCIQVFLNFHFTLGLSNCVAGPVWVF